MLRIDQYAYKNACIDVHPVEKAVFSFSLLLLSIATKNVMVAIITFTLVSVMIVIAAKIPLRYYIKLLSLPLVFLLSSVLVILVSVVSIDTEVLNALWQVEMGIWKLYISSANLEQSINMIFTVMTSISCMYFMILTTPVQQLIWLLQKCRVPKLFLELALFTYHFIFVLLGKSHQIYIAQSNRLGYRTYRSGLASSGQLIVSLFIKSMISAKNFQMALDSRGGEDGLYDVETNQSYKPAHWLIISLFLIGLLVLDHLTKKV